MEPNRDHHASLTKRIEEAGLEDVYEIVPVGVEDLTQYFEGKQGKVDCIVTVQCLCSVNNPERMIRELYGWLEEGGKWNVYEHVVIFGWQGWEMKWYQSEFIVFLCGLEFECRRNEMRKIAYAEMV